MTDNIQGEGSDIFNLVNQNLILANYNQTSKYLNFWCWGLLFFCTSFYFLEYGFVYHLSICVTMTF